jgi:disulfide bond formation protein DsbB
MLNDRFKFIYFAFLLNLVAFCGSMYFSNIMMLPPCVLCWYQRICIFPLVLIFAVGFFRKDENVFWYALPLNVIGFCISLYHNLLYYKIIPESIIPCSSGVSCTSKQIEYLGFITIPFMALTALTLTFILIMLFYRSPKEN